ncbi:uncharacterized protein LOC133305782 [Gastrolobium bilobum]|uniref:uncharacterized protein LOC133305782 n=1 Tax=Gastrolobium bilobum TaxID=150636 RepID=UPI002AB10FE9|nr:uncharacterized protein LOC133305782 [Gastrolobium bilobum]
MARNENASMEVQPVQSKKGLLQLGNNDTSLAEQKVISQQLASMNAKLYKMQISTARVNSINCEYCKEEHETNEFPTLIGAEPFQVNGVWYDPRPPQNTQSFQRNQNGAQGSNFQRRNQEGGLDYKSNNYLQPPSIPNKEPSELEKAMLQLTKTTNDHMQTTDAFMNETRSYHKNQDASIRNLETQIGQLSRQLAERAQGRFPSDTIVNPKEDCKSIVTRSGIVITPQDKPKVVPKNKVDEPVIEPEHEKEVEKLASEKEEAKEKPIEAPKKLMDCSRFEKPPYPMKFKQQAQKQQYARKHKLQDCETVALTEEFSAIIQKKFPPKLRDPGSFNIPIAIGNTNVGRALCDLGASINLMPLSICKALGISELKPTMVSLQLADRSLRRPNGVIEDVLVKVDKFIFPVDFIVLDMEEESEIPLLLGRPFLATTRATIDVEQGKLELRMNDETITINVFDAMKNSSDHSDCFRLDVFEEARDGATPQEEREVVFEVLEKKEDDSVTLAPKVKLKEIPETLKYDFLGDEGQYPVITNKELSSDEEEKLLEVLKQHKTTIGWSISDLKGINPSFCTHKILMEDNVKPVRQP